MCSPQIPAGRVSSDAAEGILQEQLRKNRERPSKRKDTALEISRPGAQSERQSLAGRLGVQQLRAPSTSLG